MEAQAADSTIVLLSKIMDKVDISKLQHNLVRMSEMNLGHQDELLTKFAEAQGYQDRRFNQVLDLIL